MIEPNDSSRLASSDQKALKPHPGKREQAEIQRAIAEQRGRAEPLSVQIDRDDNGSAMLAPPHADNGGFIVRLTNSFGTGSTDFAISQLRSLRRLIRPRGTEPGNDDALSINAALAVIDAVKPANEIEAALATQMAGTHVLAEEMLERARQAETIDQLERYAGLATKLQRAFANQIDTLGRIRRKAEQTVRVEHVHVHSGGQAIVGHVNAEGRGQSKK